MQPLNRIQKNMSQYFVGQRVVRSSSLIFQLFAFGLRLLAFRFRLSAFGFPLFAFSFLLFALSSCTRLPNVQGKGEVFLQGVWNQDSVPNASKLLNYTQHHFKISCDSFYVDLTTFSKENYYADSCFNKGVWKEYAKGTYVVKGDTLLLSGTFTKDNYKQKVAGCYRTGRYVSGFKIKSWTKQSLVLESLNDQRECLLALKQEIICTPKEL